MVGEISAADPTRAQGEVTRLLNELKGGNSNVADQLVPLIYDELRRLARRQLRNEPNQHTLQTTALVHEAYLKFTAGSQADFNSRAHFFAIASQVMRQILIDSARKRLARKRGGEVVKVSLEEGLAVTDEGLSKVLIVDDVLSALEKRDPRQARVVEMRFYVGLDFAEIADVLGVSVRTALRDWKAAQAWLYAELSQRK